MQQRSRTANSIRNAQASLFLSLFVLILGFFSRKIFIEHLSIELLGLNTTVTNLLGFLNLAELGISSAISFTLYTPLLKKDYQTINEIVSVQGWLYKKIAAFLVAGGAILMCFFPLIFSKTDLPLWNAFASFGVFLVSAVAGYVINYKQIVLSANQQEYKITLNIQGFRILKLLVQILGIGYCGLGYVFWLIVELGSSVTTCFFLDKAVSKTFPWLKTDLAQGKQLAQKYPQILQKTKQLFFHRFAGYILGQTSPLIIYAFLSLTAVAIYGNYMLLIVGITTLINSAFNGINAGVGNLVAEGSKKKINSFFRQYTVSRYWLASVVCFCLFILSPHFITLWVGEQYLLDTTSFYMLLAYTFLSLTRISDTFLSGYGLFHDIYAPIIEAILNIGLSILLGYYWGLPGILLGVSISLFSIVYCWKPYFLCVYGLKMPVYSYFLLITKILILIASSWGISLFVLSGNKACGSYLEFILYSFQTILIYGVVSFILFQSLSSDYRKSVERVFKMIRKK